jgi:signal transduction histidine kinase
MVDSLLDIARMESGEMALLLTEVNLPDLIKNVTSRLNNSTETKSLSLITAVPLDLPPLKADMEKIDRVLTNLIDNAIKFTPSGGQITISVATQAEQLIVCVINTGFVIPPADRERIFERFVQLSGETLRTRGSGLGLAFCRLAVEAHGGRIWVEPDVNGQGNNFTFTLPRS